MSDNISTLTPSLPSLISQEEEITPLPRPPRGALLYTAMQRFVGRVLLLPFGGLLVALMKLAGYRIEEHARLRREFRALTADKRPLLICANHLTFIDSALMLWAFAPNWWYVLNFRAFSWNLPAGDFFKKKFKYRVVAFLNKCIFIHRDGTKDHKNEVLSTCRYLLARGEIVTMFPEGRRSRVGRFDREHVTFGSGKILSTLPGCRVLCVYLRGHKQETYGNYPAKDSRFRVLTKVITPETTATGKRAYFELTSQVADTLLDLEKKYFEGQPA